MMRQLLVGKTAKEKSDLKSLEIVKSLKKKRYRKNKNTKVWI